MRVILLLFIISFLTLNSSEKKGSKTINQITLKEYALCHCISVGLVREGIKSFDGSAGHIMFNWEIGGSAFFRIYNAINQSTKAVLKNGYYEVNGFKFSEYYYNKLWSTGRGAPSLVAREVLDGAKSFVPSTTKIGFNRYEFGGWEMIYNPKTKEVWHLQPIW